MRTSDRRTREGVGPQNGPVRVPAAPPTGAGHEVDVDADVDLLGDLALLAATGRRNWTDMLARCAALFASRGVAVLHYAPQNRCLLQFRHWGAIHAFSLSTDGLPGELQRLQRVLDAAAGDEPASMLVKADDAGLVLEPGHNSSTALLGYQRVRQGETVGIAVLQTASETALRVTNTRRMMALLPLLADALVFEHALVSARADQRLTQHLLEQCAGSLVMLDGFGRVCSACAGDGVASMTEAYFSARSGVYLRTYYPAENARLQTAIAAALAPDSNMAAASWPAMAIHARDSHLTYALLTLQLVDPDARGSARPCLALLLREVLRRQPPSPALLRQAFGLTPAEAQLAAALLAGLAPADIARRQERSITTLRTHMRGLYRKTGTTRQTELLLALHTLIP